MTTDDDPDTDTDTVTQTNRYLAADLAEVLEPTIRDFFKKNPDKIDSEVSALIDRLEQLGGAILCAIHHELDKAAFDPRLAPPAPQVAMTPAPPPHEVAIRAMDALIRAELDSTQMHRHRRVIKVSKIAEVLGNVYATRVADVARPLGMPDEDAADWELNEGRMGMGGAVVGHGGVRLGMPPMGMGGVGMDAADLLRNATSIIQDQTQERREDRNSPINQLERLSLIRSSLETSGLDLSGIDAKIKEELGRLGDTPAPAEVDLDTDLRNPAVTGTGVQ